MMGLGYKNRNHQIRMRMHNKSGGIDYE